MSFLGIQKETPAERQIRALLFDECVQVLSSFEMNQVASLTYGDLVCDQIFEIIEDIVAQPMNYTPLSIQKALIITKHVLVYGSEKCVNSAYGIAKFMAALQEFNTVLMAQQQKGAMAIFQRIQGGGVDKGGPVREAAVAVCQLLVNIDELKKIRNSSADPNSLVPIGDDRVVFITDEVRLHLLKKRIDDEHRIRLQSNLAQSAGSFGGGYNSKDGKTVVGAAHGIEEMLKMANKHTSKFSDDGRQYNPDAAILAELAAEHKAAQALQAKAADLRRNPVAPAKPKNQAVDFDLLDFGGSPPTSASTNAMGGDLLGETDFLGVMTSSHPPETSIGNPSNDLLGLGLDFGPDAGHTSTSTASNSAIALHHDPFALLPAHATADLLGTPGGFGVGTSAAERNADPVDLLGTPGAIDALYGAPSNSLLSGVTSMLAGIGLAKSNNLNNAEAKKPIMAANEDRFSALNALTPAGGSDGPSITLSQSMVEPESFSYTKSSLDSLNAWTVQPMSNGYPPNMNDNGTFLSGGMSSPPVVPAPQTMEQMVYPSMASSVLPVEGMVPPPTMPPPLPPIGDLPSPAIARPPLPMAMPSPPPLPEPTVLAGAGHVGASYGGSPEDLEDNPWVMGGMVGSGLDPVAPAPGAPPPPPPSSF
jgi:ENTH domain